jgi:hypothetical protein
VKIPRPILVVAWLVPVRGLILEFFVPASARMIDIAAAVCGFATWIVPLLLIAMTWNKKPRSSLAVPGFVILLFAVAAFFSAMGLSLALLTFVFAQEANWAWWALLAIGSFWLLLAISLYVGDLYRRSRSARDVSK